MFLGARIQSGFQAKISKILRMDCYLSIFFPSTCFAVGGWMLGPEIIAHSKGITLLLFNVTVPPSTGNFNIPCAVDGTARIFLMPGLPIIAIVWDGDLEDHDVHPSGSGTSEDAPPSTYTLCTKCPPISTSMIIELSVPSSALSGGRTLLSRRDALATSPCRKDVVILYISSTDLGILSYRRLINPGCVIPCINPEILMHSEHPHIQTSAVYRFHDSPPVGSPYLFACYGDTMDLGCAWFAEDSFPNRVIRSS
ncbi:hypothetical protein Tco_0861052 [Tanacetum coccineum]|uniref:Uncharacterized protein n=1 Tax=Tanacetum coccineum TaxID=301880 RepID=A0ABQ5BGR5_9ASTR